LQHLLKLLVRMVADFMQCKIVSVMLLSDERTELYIQVAYGLDESVVKKSVSRVGEGIAGRVAATGRALLIENVEDLDDRNAPNHPQYETNSLLSVPLMMNGEIVGVINCNNKTSGEGFFPDDLSLLLTLTEKVTYSLSRALRFEDSRNELQKTVSALQALVDLQSTDTQPKRRMVRYAMELGRRLGLTRKQILGLQYACVVHDVGMVNVDWEILKKPGPLNNEERELIRQHPADGVELVSPFLGPDEIDEAIRYHHERVDGKGYPNGLSGDHIPLAARIVAIVDAFDSMTSTRAYRPARVAADAAAELIKEAGTQFDPEIVRLFIDILAENGEINRDEWTQLKESDPCLRPASLS
jgi:HD-GYP domain-containing protein (c-di-GMP phosphodiesterase class II)